MFENFNIPQSIIALAEAYLLTGNGKESLVYAVSTLLATGVQDLGLNLSQGNATNEKYLVEPIVSAILAILGKNFFLSKKEGKGDKYVKTGMTSFLLTGSSAGLNNVINFGYMRSTNPSFQNVSSYSQARATLASVKAQNPNVSMPYASTIVA